MGQPQQVLPLRSPDLLSRDLPVKGQLDAIVHGDLRRGGSPAPCHPVLPMANYAQNGHGCFCAKLAPLPPA